MKPLGIQCLEHTRKSTLSCRAYQTIVLILTFFAYASYHASRKSISIVKSTLDPNSTQAVLSPWHSIQFLGLTGRVKPMFLSTSGWSPFNQSNGTQLLGILDLAFLILYSVGMFFSGQLGDRLNIRVFLTVGMMGTGLFTCLFGVGYWLEIHNFFYFLVIQMLAGLFQSTGWPSVVAVVGSWFGKGKRGLIMGIWNAHTSVGNISGSLIAAAMLKHGWGWSFVVPGLLIAFMGILVYLFLPVSPVTVGITNREDGILTSPNKNGACKTCEPLLTESIEAEECAVGFMQAWKIPGVATFAFCLFFSKLVVYTFLYWLPFYISHTEVDGRYLSDEAAGNLSTIFDVGGVVGSILAGHISDWLEGRAITAAGFMLCAIPSVLFYRIYGEISLFLNMVLMFNAGIFVNGPYALITTAVSADLGTHCSLHVNSRALATVAAIIDGTGSVGAAVGPLLTGYISATSWNGVFIMLMVSAFVASLLLTNLVISEVAAKIGSSAEPRQYSQIPVN